MRIANIIGTVTLSRAHSSLRGATWKMAVPLGWDQLVDDEPATREALVLYDELGAGQGSRVMLSEGREASQPFHPEVKPIDAYNSGILDDVYLGPSVGQKK